MSQMTINTQNRGWLSGNNTFLFWFVNRLFLKASCILRSALRRLGLEQQLQLGNYLKMRSVFQDLSIHKVIEFYMYFLWLLAHIHIKNISIHISSKCLLHPGSSLQLLCLEVLGFPVEWEFNIQTWLCIQIFQPSVLNGCLQGQSLCWFSANCEGNKWRCRYGWWTNRVSWIWCGQITRYHQTRDILVGAGTEAAFLCQAVAADL